MNHIHRFTFASASVDTNMGRKKNHFRSIPFSFYSFLFLFVSSVIIYSGSMNVIDSYIEPHISCYRYIVICRYFLLHFFYSYFSSCLLVQFWQIFHLNAIVCCHRLPSSVTRENYFSSLHIFPTHSIFFFVIFSFQFFFFSFCHLYHSTCCCCLSI